MLRYNITLSDQNTNSYNLSRMIDLNMKKFVLLILTGLFCTSTFALNVVVTIKPLHSLVQSILGDSNNAKLLLDSSASPHDVQLKPSDIRELNKADVVILVDQSFEGFMQRIIQSAPNERMIIELSQDEAIMRLNARDHLHETHTDTDHSSFDPHLWLNPQNAKLIIRNITRHLIELDEVNTDLYRKNLDKTLTKLDQLDNDLKTRLNGFEKLAYITQHDAYQYFENRYKLNFIKAISLDSSIPPSVKLALNIQNDINTHNVRCIFREPQFSERLVNTLAESANIKTAELDPIGINLTPGPDLYFDLMTNLADNFAKCLTHKS